MEEITVQETIKYIEQHGYIDDAVKDMCIKALEKRTKKKPKKISSKVSDVIIHYYCPTCGRKFGQRGVHNVILFLKEKYCNGCGQALDWSEENERDRDIKGSRWVRWLD